MGGIRMIAVLLALVAAAGTALVYDALLAGTADERSATRTPRARRAPRGVRVWLAQAGLEEVDPREFVAVSLVLGALGAAAGWIIFAGAPAALALGLFAAGFPVTGYRMRRRNRMAAASDAWPRMIEEIRVQTGSLGRSIPQALLDVGLRGPEELRPSFAAAHREWMISTDFERTVGVLKARLADATADMVCETLLVAHEVGGADIDRRLEALAHDRMQDCQGRKDARSRQAGARFARRFVLFVPFGMALAGMSVGDGRDAYRSSSGQLLALAGIALVAACWVWAGRVMRLPQEERVFG